jgi:isoleucyl-tRNA synthetase
MESLDRFALDVASRAHERVQAAYNDYEFHKVYHTLHNLCVTDLSAFYLDILKDRLYSSAKDSRERRSAQTAMLHILRLLIRDMAPVLSFTAEEVFQFLPEDLKNDAKTVFAVSADDIPLYTMPAEERAAWEKLLIVRSEITKAIEPVRKSGEIGHGLDTHVTLFLNDELAATLNGLKTDMRANFIVSKLTTAPLADAPESAFTAEEVEGLRIGVAKAPGAKCERCWIYSEELGTDPAHPAICPRCTGVLQTMTLED